MFRSKSKLLALLAALFLFPITLQTVLAGDNQWLAVSPEELAMKAPKIEPDADAEALLWDVYVANEVDMSTEKTVLRHYLRIKIFTEKGREDNSKVDIPFGKISGIGANIKIQDIAARTIKADGTIVELTPKDIFERDILKANRVKIRAKSFALPGIEVGSIVEYRWKEIRDGVNFRERFEFARSIPTHLVRYHIKPANVPYGMRLQSYNGRYTPFVKEKDNYYVTSMTNVGSFKEEPKMPDEYAVKPWLMIYYTDQEKIEPKKYWENYGKRVYELTKAPMKVNDDIKKATAEAVGDATEPMQKLERIFNYVRSHVKDIGDDASGLTSEQLKQIKENKNAGDVLKRGTGDWQDIDVLFAAMVTAAGFEARIANLPLRTDTNFDPSFTESYFMKTMDVAVKVGEEWKFFDPGSRYIPFGMLSWAEEGVPTLVSDFKAPIWTETLPSAPEKSLEKRTGKFKLLEDGTLEGEGRIEFTGHTAVLHKEYNDDDTPAQREQTLRNLVKSNILGSAEISNFTIENVTDPDKPFIYTFKVRVPGYATRTGKRFFIQPNVFERGSSPLFTANTRKYNISLEYPWSESDDITIDLPAGYSLESPDSPAPVQDPNGISSNIIKMSITKDGRTIFYKRNFVFGNRGQLLFPASAYPAVKNLFDLVYKANTHLTLKQDAAQTTASPPAVKGN